MIDKLRNMRPAPPSGHDEASIPGPHEPGVVGGDHGLHAVAYLELAQNGGDVALDRCLADVEALRDLRIRESAGEQAQRLRLALREIVERALVVAALAREPCEQTLRRRWSEQRVAGGDDADRVDQIRRLNVLEQKAARAGVD